MSIGKSSIVRAANATATKAATTTTDNVVTEFLLDSIGVLSIAKTPNDIDSVKLSIKKRGILCPILIAITKNGDKWLLDGYRRFFAAKELGISQINAAVINVENKSDANHIYNELVKTKPVLSKIDTNDIHEEKFRVLAVKDHDLPVHLL